MDTLRRVQESRAERRVRFRVASARSGRVLREVFREDEEGTEDSADSDTACCSAERAISPAISEANGHLIGLALEQQGDSASESDDLLVYASAAHQQLFSRKRVNIFSKNGTIRGVRDKVSAGQVLFNNLSKLYGAKETMSVKNLQEYKVVQSRTQPHIWTGGLHKEPQ